MGSAKLMEKSSRRGKSFPVEVSGETESWEGLDNHGSRRGWKSSKSGGRYSCPQKSSEGSPERQPSKLGREFFSDIKRRIFSGGGSDHIDPKTKRGRKDIGLNRLY